ncbi:5'-methylthioadenosine/S-adenosylhomocysteine nucleosidase family protein [Caldicellulosiruptor morganii]|uniref:Purine phosphorylase n=1 Tax=Caldicellulosiruptor morganii TaxID=1387555 RepID=A0ABY7BQJ4_9FIRM|nr:purine phosphorylase [Caldicellulosiruptor morganii]WAM33699.1 purine phosphorylase [Caldicellulosiruptor morganii]
MIFIVTAYHQEARALIKHFSLKKLYEPSKFQIFTGNDIILIESRQGIVKSSIATTFALTSFKAAKMDIALNIGICGAKENTFTKGDGILCNKIINHHSKKRFYPDILINHSMKEATLESFMHPVKKESLPPDIEGDIVDMEGAGFFEAASLFLPPHNIHCIKIVHDFLDFENINPAEVENLIEQGIPYIEDIINSLSRLNCEFSDNLPEPDDIHLLVNKLKDNLKLTAYMKNELEDLLKGYFVRHKKLPEELFDFLNISSIKSKKEVKEHFDRLKKILLG